MGQAAASEGWELLLVEQTFMERLLDARRWARCSCYRQRGNIGPALQTLSIFEPRALMPVEKARQKLDMQGTDGALSVGGGQLERQSSFKSPTQDSVTLGPLLHLGSGALGPQGGGELSFMSAKWGEFQQSAPGQGGSFLPWNRSQVPWGWGLGLARSTAVVAIQ